MSQSNSSGFSLASVLVIVFFVLKMTGGITWSWWWVFAPWLISAGLLGLIVAVYVLLRRF